MERSTLITVQNKTYECKYPTVDDLLKINAIQQIVTKNKYDQMAQSTLATAQVLLDIVDAFAHLSILCPSFMEAIKIDKISDLEPKAGRELSEIYEQQFLPWFLKINEELFGKKEKTDDAK